MALSCRWQISEAAGAATTPRPDSKAADAYTGLWPFFFCILRPKSRLCSKGARPRAQTTGRRKWYE